MKDERWRNLPKDKKWGAMVENAGKGGKKLGVKNSKK